MYDCIVIGKGPAGITASIYMKRANVNCLVIGQNASALVKTSTIENYYGFPNPISGEELLDNGINQAKRLGIEVVTEEVISIEYMGQYYIVKTKNYTYEAKTVLLATGTSRNTPKIAGIKEFEGKGVSYCAICDAFFYRGKEVAVLGNGDYALHEAEILLPVAKKVTVLTNGKELIQNRSIEVEDVDKTILEVKGDATVKEVRFVDQTSVPIDGLFIAEGTASSTDFARKLGAIIEGKNIQVNEDMQTNIPGLYAAGDCTGGLLQISKAVYEGTKAGLAIAKYVRNK